MPPEAKPIPPLTSEQEDQVILARIVNDERAIKRVYKKFHIYTQWAHPNSVPTPTNDASKDGSSSVEEARDSFLVELAAVELLLRKNDIIGEAEDRQAEEYRREQQRIDVEHGTLRGQIEQLKTSLEHAQLVRKQKMEYDQVAEKINTLPSREELTRAIQDLENDMTTINIEHETQTQLLKAQKASLDSVITELASLRFVGKEREGTASGVPSPRASPGPEGVPECIDADIIPDPLTDSSRSGDEGSERDSSGQDIEMGEVDEGIKEVKGKKKAREEMEEGEATDGSSELSEPTHGDL